VTIEALFDLTGKVALVTGGSRGLGYQMVRAFAEHGADIVVASRKIENCEAVADEIRALGGRAFPYPSTRPNGNRSTPSSKLPTQSWVASTSS
jgi:NAD(P)-dependent dehydrogenase (short-subunit alcohol dehydrogenase family)